MYGFNDLKDKVVVITGGTGLIGRELCVGFGQWGANVIIAARNKEKGLELEKEMIEKGFKSKYYKLDISKEDDISNLIDNIEKDYSTIDVFINNAFPRTDDWQTNLEDVGFDSMTTNLKDHLGGYFLCAQKAMKVMKKKKQGSIINFGSIYGVVAPNFSVYDDTKMTCAPAYPLIKGGILTMTKYFSTYLAKDNIRVNCVCPGGIFDNQDEKFVEKYEKLVPLGRMGKPEDIVGTVLYLASNLSSYVTGQSLMVDGGWSAW